MHFFSDRLTKSILDPIHGLIRMTDEEMRIISHPLFHRLRGVKQNTFLYYVFPSSNHTRFEHSIGVMHLASEMFLSSFDNASTLNEKRVRYGLHNPNDVLVFNQIKKFEEIFLDLRIAALLHDIGHGPMSHLFDKFSAKNKDFIDMVMNDNNLNDNKSTFSRELASKLRSIVEQKLEDHVEHELVSYYFTATVLREIGIPILRIKRILNIMNGHLSLSQEIVTIEDNKFELIPFLNNIVAGAPLDCDRMDYLLRDSFFSGVKYGTYDLNRLNKSLIPFVDTENKIIRLGIKKSGLPAIENFLQARYQMFVQVYFHKTNRSCNVMLEKATENLRQEVISCSDVETFKRFYLDHSDEKFLVYIKDLIKEDNRKEIIDDLINRRLWKRVLEIYPEETSRRSGDIEDALNLAVRVISDSNSSDFVKEDLIKNNPVKDLDDNKTVLLQKDVNENYHASKDKNWLNDSIIFKALKSEYIVGRVFIQADVSSNENKQEFRRIKLNVKKALKELNER